MPAAGARPGTVSHACGRIGAWSGRRKRHLVQRLWANDESPKAPIGLQGAPESLSAPDRLHL
eukprot:124003-Chlamydomonas_euryale.AAC.11